MILAIKYLRLISLAAVIAVSLQTVSVSAADEGPSLDVTMAFIREKLSTLPMQKISAPIVENNGNTGHRWYEEKPYNEITVSGCRISFNQDNNKYYLDLGTESDISVISGDDYLQRQAAKSTDHITGSAEPSGVVLIVGSSFTQLFYDASLADRVAKAMARAAKLCGGLKSEAF